MKPIREEVMNYDEFVPYLGQPRDCIVCGSKHKKEWARKGPFRAVECRNCSLVWMDPFLTKKGFEAYYNNYIKFRLENTTKMEQRQKMYELDRTFLEQFVQGGALLDVGCSEGLFLEVLSPDFDKYGIDVDPEAIERGRKLGRVPADRLRVGALGDDDFETASFDVITMRGTIEHLPEPHQAIARVAKLLKDNGIFYITATPNIMSFCAYLYREKWNQFDPVQHIYHFSAKTLGQLAEQFSLSLVAQTYPYLETPYADLQKDHEKVIQDYHLIQSGRRDEVTRSPAFWGNMMTLVFRKKP